MKHGNGKSPCNGVPKPIYTEYLKSIGWKWTPTMHIGSGCKVHLKGSELPKGRLIVRISSHMTAILDRVIHDTYDPQRSIIIMENGIQRIAGRCVYGYWAIS